VDCFRFCSHRTLSFFSMGTRVGLIFLLSAAVPLNLSRVQNFTALNPSGSPAVVKARLECIKIRQAVYILGLPAKSRFAVFNAFRNPDQLWPISLIGELGRVVKHENRAVRRRCTFTRRLKVARQNVRFADAMIGEETVRRLRVCPILANKQDTLPYVAPDPFEQCAKSLAKLRIPKLAPGDFPINPCCRNISGANVAISRPSAQRGTHGAPSLPNQVLNNESQQILSIQVFTSGGAARKPQKCG
jgi:hypothetical protein